jgi:hypothetical protein
VLLADTPVAFGEVQRALGVAGKAYAVRAVMAGQVGAVCSVAGGVALVPMVMGRVEVDDEETALAILGLPSDVVL